MSFRPSKVANEFLRLARADTPPHVLTPLQLIKLVYIAHGWSLVYLGDPLLSEHPEAWQYGPVVRSLYQEVRAYKAGPITDPIVDDDPTGNELSSKAKQLIKAVYDSYKHLSGIQLSNMTHQPGTPWSQVWTGAGRNAIIPNQIIERHYKELAARRTPVT